MASQPILQGWDLLKSSPQDVGESQGVGQGENNPSGQPNKLWGLEYYISTYTSINHQRLFKHKHTMS